MQWLPIESAPKDGTMILLADRLDRHSPYVGWWDDKTDGPKYPWKFIDGNNLFQVDEEGDRWLLEPNGARPGNFTHWMPLPEPPQSDA